MRSRFTSFVSLPLLQAVYVQVVSATVTNYTIDDTFGDSRTGQKVVYQPSNLWGNQTCVGCAILPDASKMVNGTYHEATWNPGEPQLTIKINFTGTGIFVFFTLVDNPNAYNSAITTTTAVNFTLDKTPPRLFTYGPRREQQFLFQSPVFTQNVLPPGNHTLFISGPAKTGESIYVNFDYAIYTDDDVLEGPLPKPQTTSQAQGISTTSASGTSFSSTVPSPSSHPRSRVAIISGATTGVISLVVAIALVICYVQRRRRQREVIQVVPFTPRAHFNSQQTRQPPPPPPPEMREATMRRGNLPTPSLRPARQEALENRVIALEQEILDLTTALASRGTNTPAHQPTIAADENDDGITTSDLSERMKAIHVEYLEQQWHLDGAERPLDDLPPEYTPEDI